MSHTNERKDKENQMNIDKMMVISRWNQLYREGNPEVTDQEYDNALDSLEKVLTPDTFHMFRRSLTEMNGDVVHHYVIGSLEKVKYDEGDFGKWYTKMKLPSYLFWSDKMDGMSYVAIYNKGILTSLATRGDGTTGCDITSKASHIQIPTTLKFCIDCEVRGELVFLDDDYLKCGYSNPRNGVVGCVTEDEVYPEKLKYVKAYAYQVLSSHGTIIDQFDTLQYLGFTVPRHGSLPVNATIENTLKAIVEEDTPYLKDGLVISMEDYTNENVFLPKRMVAFKVNSEGIPCKVVGIEWTTSKNRLIKPVVLIEPTVIDMTTVSRVTGFNCQYIRDNSINVGSVIGVVKSGQVIPYITSIIKESYPNPPAVCPACCGEVKMEGVDLVCQNESCGGASIKTVESFIKNSGIENVSEKRLAEWGINTFDDLLSWEPEIDYKSQTKFYYDLIEKVFHQDTTSIMRNFSFNGFGQTLFDKVYEYTCMEDLYLMDRVFNTDVKEWNLPEGVGVRTIDKASDDWKINWEVLTKIINDSRYVASQPKEKKVMLSNSLAGKSFLFTGKLSETREYFEQIVKDNGGSIASSVSKNLDYLVVGEKAGSKLDKAQKLGTVNILDEQEFTKLL
jgi:DNA ligase (NAD+)